MAKMVTEKKRRFWLLAPVPHKAAGALTKSNPSGAFEKEIYIPVRFRLQDLTPEWGTGNKK